MESFQFLSRFNFYQLLLLALFLAAAFLASGLARGFVAAAFLATALFGAAFFLAAFGASSSPSAGFDDCEHRLIPSCSIPASDRSGPAFSSVVMDSISARSGSDSLKPHKNKRREEIPRRVGRTYSRWQP